MGKSTKTSRIYVVAVAAILAVICIAMVTFVPNMSLWAKSYTNGCSGYATLQPGESVSCEFTAPFKKLTGISIDFPGMSSYEAPIGKIQARLVLQDASANILFSGNIASLIEEDFSVDRKLVPGEVYTLTLYFDSATEEIESIGIGVTSAGQLSYGIKGLNNGAPMKSTFIVLFAVAALFVLLYALSISEKDLKRVDLIDKLLFLFGLILAVVIVNQFYDLVMTAKCGLRLIETIKSGKFFDYYNHAYSSELANGSASMFFGYNYNVLLILPVAILMLPFSFFTDGNTGYDTTGLLMAYYLNIVVAILVAWSVKLTEKICDACEMPDSYKKSVKYIYAFSPLLLYVSVVFGQIDIMYVIIMLWALPFYFKGRYKMFSLLMAFSVVMKLIPLLVFFPLILLTNKKIKDIALNTLICLSVKAGTLLLFERSAGYRSVMTLMKDWHSFIEKLFDSKLGASHSLFIMAFTAICILCYMKDLKKDSRKELLYHSMLVIFSVYGSFVAFVDWHPQWVIPFIVSLAYLLPFFAEEKRIFIIATMLEPLMILGVEKHLNATYMVDNSMIAYGNGYSYSGISIPGILSNISPVTTLLITSVEAMIVLFFIYYFISKRNTIALEKDSQYAVDRPISVGRILFLYGFLVFVFWCYCFIG